MIKVAGIWQDGWGLTAEIEWALWEFPCRTYEVAQWYMSPIRMPDRGKMLTQVDTVQDAIDQNPDFTPIFVEEAGTTDLTDFEHPENALYIFGSEGESAWLRKGQPGISVQIPVPINGILWGHQCVPLVLQHRHGLNF